MVDNKITDKKVYTTYIDQNMFKFIGNFCCIYYKI